MAGTVSRPAATGGERADANAAGAHQPGPDPGHGLMPSRRVELGHPSMRSHAYPEGVAKKLV